MLENLNVVAILIITIWLVALGYYFYTSRQQEKIRKDLDSLREMLEEVEKEQE